MSALRASILGGVDGVITSFAIVAGSHAGNLSGSAVIIVGASSIIADGFSMGISEYLSSVSANAEKIKNKEIISSRSTTPSCLGVVCFISFVLCGTVPVLSYMLASQNLLSASMFSLAELMVLGAVRTFVSEEPLLYGLLQTSLLGSLAGGVAYGVGLLAYQLDS